MIDGFREFEFDLPDALLVSLVATFDAMQGAPLTLEHVVLLPEEQGVYQLIYAEKIVYVGKTDGEAGLRQRLTRHAWTVQHRCNLVPERVLFKALRVFVFTAIDLETQLIQHYGGQAQVSWNNSGFGSNDPGRERDTTKIKQGGFDEQFPIDLDKEIELVSEEMILPAIKVLGVLRANVSYTIRAQSAAGKVHPDLMVETRLHSGPTTARRTLAALLHCLPAGWQATLLPGRVILYKEDRTYLAGAVVGRS